MWQTKSVFKCVLYFRINKSKGNGKSRLPSKYQDELEQDEGLALLIPDIQETANLVQVSSQVFTC